MKDLPRVLIETDMSIDDWMTIDFGRALPKLVKTYMKYLGKDSFFELY